jgi:AcrR family transcriptional regulator
VPDTVTERRAARTAEIIDGAWALARQHGVAGMSLRALAREVGIRQPSLYEYFDSKNALYDEMFADGNRRLLERFDAVRLPDDPRAALKQLLHTMTDFAMDDPARCELLFERHVPDFTPSADSYALADVALGRMVVLMNDAGMTDQGDIDCLVAMVAGLMEAQLANDPGGDRWLRHLDRMVDLHLDNAVTNTDNDTGTKNNRRSST